MGGVETGRGGLIAFSFAQQYHLVCGKLHNILFEYEYESAHSHTGYEVALGLFLSRTTATYGKGHTPANDQRSDARMSAFLVLRVVVIDMNPIAFLLAYSYDVLSRTLRSCCVQETAIDNAKKDSSSDPRDRRNIFEGS